MYPTFLKEAKRLKQETVAYRTRSVDSLAASLRWAAYKRLPNEEQLRYCRRGVQLVPERISNDTWARVEMHDELILQGLLLGEDHCSNYLLSFPIQLFCFVLID